jgi:hypothetical protein
MVLLQAGDLIFGSLVIVPVQPYGQLLLYSSIHVREVCFGAKIGKIVNISKSPDKVVGGSSFRGGKSLYLFHCLLEI